MNKKVEKKEQVKTEADLKTEIVSLKKKLMSLKMKNLKGELKDTSLIKQTKKQIAQLFTQMNKKK